MPVKYYHVIRKSLFGISRELLESNQELSQHSCDSKSRRQELIVVGPLVQKKTDLQLQQ